MKIRVLVVDDEPDFLDSIVRRLQLRGLDAQGVNRGQAALDMMAQSPVDVVVLDIKMPGLSGLETLRHIRSRYPTVGVIVLTGHASHELNATGLELGAFDYLIKPVKLDDVVERIHSAIEAQAKTGIR
jgi:DNA-binding response OmpR family regulator